VSKLMRIEDKLNSAAARRGKFIEIRC